MAERTDPCTFSPTSWPRRDKGLLGPCYVSLGDLYLYSFYWAMTTLTTIGYVRLCLLQTAAVMWSDVVLHCRVTSMR